MQRNCARPWTISTQRPWGRGLRTTPGPWRSCRFATCFFFGVHFTEVPFVVIVIQHCFDLIVQRFGLCFFLSAKLIRGLRQSQIWLSRGREIGLLLSLADRSWYLKQALQTGLLLLMTALLVATQNHKVFIIGGGICLAMNFYLGRSGYKRFTLCLQQHQGFFNYLGPALYTRLTRLNLSLNAIQPGLAGLLFVAGVSWN